MNIRRTIAITGAALALAGVALIAVNRDTGAAGITPSGRTVNLEGQFITDFSDPRRIAGFVDHLVLAEVVERKKQATKPAVESNDDRVRTSVAVKVIESIQGSLTGTVTITQLGGLDPATGDMIVVEDTPLMEVGKKYLIGAKTDTASGENLALPGFGVIRLDDQKQYDEARETFKRARDDAKPPPGDPTE